MFVFWTMWSRPISCPSMDKQVWAVYVALIRLLSPFPPPFAPRIFFLCFYLTLASLPLSVHNQFSHWFFSAHIAPHLPSLSNYVFFTSKHLFQAFEYGECGVWVRCFSSAVCECAMSAVFSPKRCTVPEVLFWALRVSFSPDLLSMFLWTRNSLVSFGCNWIHGVRVRILCCSLSRLFWVQLYIWG
jgi:hypothetical protein